MVLLPEGDDPGLGRRVVRDVVSKSNARSRTPSSPLGRRPSPDTAESALRHGRPLRSRSATGSARRQGREHQRGAVRPAQGRPPPLLLLRPSSRRPERSGSEATRGRGGARRSDPEPSARSTRSPVQLGGPPRGVRSATHAGVCGDVVPRHALGPPLLSGFRSSGRRLQRADGHGPCAFCPRTRPQRAASSAVPSGRLSPTLRRHAIYCIPSWLHQVTPPPDPHERDTAMPTLPAKQTIVLVHGAYADSSSWNGSIPALSGRPPRDRGREPAARPRERRRVPPERPREHRRPDRHRWPLERRRP